MAVTSVADFGAVGNGTDETVAISNAWTVAKTLKRKLYFPTPTSRYVTLPCSHCGAELTFTSGERSRTCPICHKETTRSIGYPAASVALFAIIGSGFLFYGCLSDAKEVERAIGTHTGFVLIAFAALFHHLARRL